MLFSSLPAQLFGEGRGSVLPEIGCGPIEIRNLATGRQQVVRRVAGRSRY